MPSFARWEQGCLAFGGGWLKLRPVASHERDLCPAGSVAAAILLSYLPPFEPSSAPSTGRAALSRFRQVFSCFTRSK